MWRYQRGLRKETSRLQAPGFRLQAIRPEVWSPEPEVYFEYFSSVACQSLAACGTSIMGLKITPAVFSGFP